MVGPPVYDEPSRAGKTEKVSLPYVEGDPIYWTEAAYDGIGRPLKVIPLLYQMGDIELARELGLGDSTFEGDASKAIRDFVDKGCCKVKKYFPAASLPVFLVLAACQSAPFREPEVFLDEILCEAPEGVQLRQISSVLDERYFTKDALQRNTRRRQRSEELYRRASQAGLRTARRRSFSVDTLMS